ncbi:MAG: hypothetical protein K2N23_00165 [Clostridia bacterium]|nr:hypothetical protein [Clostridia bacterium]
MDETTAKEKFINFLTRYGHFLWIAGLAFIFMTVCSTCSFMYPNNEWVDSNIYFTVGKAMLKGKVLYRDIFDHKGFYIYALHSVAYLISHRTFIGIYLVEIALAFVFAYAEYRILLLYLEKKYALICLPFIMFASYSSFTLFHGDSAEELVMPFMAVSLWYLLEYAKGGKVSLIRYAAVGAFAAIAFWIKYTLCGFYLGWAVIMLIFELKDKTWKHLLAGIGAFFGAFLVVSLPVFIYFGVHGAFKDLWEVYFYDNLFVYSSGTRGNIVGFIKKIFWPLWVFIRSIYFGLSFYLLILPGFVYLIFTKDINRREKAAIFTTYGCMNFLIYAGGRGGVYYGFTVCMYAFIGMVALCKLKFTSKALDKVLKKFYVVAGICVFALSGLSLAVNPIRYRVFSPTSSRVQYKFAKIIEETHFSGNILNYNALDLGINTATDTVPECKYFFKPNIKLDEITDTQKEWVTEGKADYVVCIAPLPEAISEKYELLATARQRSDTRIETYYLYALKEFTK